MKDQEYLRQAIELKKQSVEPVPCACVIVIDGKIVAQTVNSQREDNASLNHAEIKAVYEANRKTGSRKLHGATAYCSCEPCVMCLSALSLAEIDRIVFKRAHERCCPRQAFIPARFSGICGQVL